jgi:hypothetical protein
MESLSLWEKYNPDTSSFDGVTFDDFERFARIVAYKVAHNLKLGMKMDPEFDPLELREVRRLPSTMNCACGNPVERERELAGLSLCYRCGLAVPRRKGIMVSSAQRPAYGADEADIATDCVLVSEVQHGRLMRHGVT